MVQKKKKKRKHRFWFRAKYLRNILSGDAGFKSFSFISIPMPDYAVDAFTGLLLKYRETFFYLIKIKCFCCGFFLGGRGR